MMMAKKPGERFQTMAEVASALLAVPLPERTSAPARPMSTGGTAEQSTTEIRANNAADQTITLPPQAASAPEPQLGGWSSGFSRPSRRGRPAKAGTPTSQSALDESDRLTALLVESSRAQAAIIGKHLERLGLKHTSVATVADAVAAVRRQMPDVVLSAMFLKDGTGVQLGRELAVEHLANAPGFVLITSQEESKTVGSLSDCGTAVSLHKPFTAETLADALRTLAAQPASDPKDVPADRSSLRVLIVDDSAVARAIEKQVLTSLGFTQIAEVMDGAQAVAAVALQAFDLIVTDYHMPMMDGAALINYLRQVPATAKTPIIMVTSETDEAVLQPIRALGVAAVCAKSFPIDAVRPIISRLFG